MRKILPFILAIFCISMVSAIDVDVQKLSSNEVLVIGTGEPAKFDLSITNNGQSGNFEFYNIVSFKMSPDTVFVGEGETKNLSLELIPLGDISERGSYTITYYLKGDDGTQEQRTLTFRILEIEDALTIYASDLDPESTSVDVSIKNNENFDFESIDVRFDSQFFTFDGSLMLGPMDTETFNVELNPDDLRGLMAGFYTLTAEVSAGNDKGVIESVIKFVEKDIVTTVAEEFGFLINSKIIEKTNDGNVIQQTETVVKKNIIPRLFTSLDPAPDIVEREGATVYYTWIDELRPGQTIEITVKTNWLFPFIVILFIVGIFILTRRYSRANLMLKKKITFVHAKGGEFALKVSIFVSAKKYLERVNVTDRLPPLVDVYERFGGEKPVRIDKKNKRLEWSFEKLEAGEMRVLSYVIYSKVGVLGRFALPSATAIYEKDGEIHEAESNRAFFVAEQRKKRIEEEDALN